MNPSEQIEAMGRQTTKMAQLDIELESLHRDHYDEMGASESFIVTKTETLYNAAKNENEKVVTSIRLTESELRFIVEAAEFFLEPGVSARNVGRRR
jgi:MoaA/NifB/PqqE/SkfB family radical SAM enzyme